MKISASLLVGGVRATQPTQPSFEQWQSQYGMNSADDRMQAQYEVNVILVNEMNTVDSEATFAVNQFSGMNFADFKSKYLTYRPGNDTAFPSVEVSQALESSVDWVKKGMVTPVKEQFGCGSCWAFSCNAAIESIYKQQTGRNVILSEQQLVDCTYGNNGDGCIGGNELDGLDYFGRGHPVCTAGSYKYHAKKGSCKDGSCRPAGIAIHGYNSFPRGENGLDQALQRSVTMVGVEVTPRFGNYKSGVLNPTSNQVTTDHSVLAVAYTNSYYKIKNSWGKGWGEGGYIRITRNKGWSHGSFAVALGKPMVPKVSSGGRQKNSNFDEVDADLVV